MSKLRRHFAKYMKQIDCLPYDIIANNLLFSAAVKLELVPNLFHDSFNLRTSKAKFQLFDSFSSSKRQTSRIMKSELHYFLLFKFIGIVFNDCYTRY